MKTTYFFAGICTALFSLNAFSHNIQPAMPLPKVAVNQVGELVLKGQEITYQPWQSGGLAGKVRVIQHMAGRSSVKEKNEALMEAIRAEKFDASVYQTTTIINADDALVGTGMFVKSSAEKGKKANPHSQVILDQQSAVKNAWDLKEKDSLIVVTDKNGKVKFVKEGKLSPQEIQTVIGLVRGLIR
ncbi:YtfJ family protein [Caviibacterium pharyngocola]|uniref:YtfJ family protein n=1 Tax=Caviibacterium pharyngocola TaxID=28159 RepID=A0A2M8RW61_9PAST|nr:YtfJ family protein [Caviibacterium pharyngocola]PJG83103.1 YtfJ family protein [Caviibacterium pharyngocola]